MPDKRSQHELKRLVEQAVADVCGLPRPGLWLCVDLVEVRGRPPERLKVWATLHFLPDGSPFCCGESGCHLGLFGKRLQQIGERLRHTMALKQEVSVDFGHHVNVYYHPGIAFHDGHF
jgi:hypothetical protein